MFRPVEISLPSSAGSASPLTGLNSAVEGGTDFYSREKRAGYNLKYRRKHLAKLRANARRKYWEGHDRSLLKNRLSYLKHRERRLAYARGYNLRTVEKRRKYRKANRERDRASRRIWDSKEKNRIRRNSKARDRYWTDPRVKANHLQYRRRNSHKYCIYTKNFRLRNLGKVRRYQKAYRQSHRDNLLRRMREWYRKNKEHALRYGRRHSKNKVIHLTDSYVLQLLQFGKEATPEFLELKRKLIQLTRSIRSIKKGNSESKHSS